MADFRRFPMFGKLGKPGKILSDNDFGRFALIVGLRFFNGTFDDLSQGFVGNKQWLKYQGVSAFTVENQRNIRV